MRTFIITLIVLLCCSVAYSQPLNQRKWSTYLLPIDSLEPISLIFYDSTHGYLTGFKDTAFLDDTLRAFNYGPNYFLFETFDGGKSWMRNTDTNIVRTNRVGVGGFGSTIHYANLLTRYTENYSRGRITRSDDYGKSWKKVWNSYGNNKNFQLLTVLDSRDLLVYDWDSEHIYKSYDGGFTYPTRLGDGLFHDTLWPDTSNNSIYGLYKGGINFIAKDALHYTALVQGVRVSPDTSELNIHLKELFPSGIRTLITENGGASWKLFETPEDSFAVNNTGTLQYATGTSNLYYFTGDGFSHARVFGEGAVSDGDVYHYWEGSRPVYGINYFYSPDDGRTWRGDTMFSRRRRGYEVVKENELWFTLTRDNLNFRERFHAPAYILARTTDNGLTYEYDSTTLNGRYVGEFPLDGRIITFSDPRHGWIAAVQEHKTYIFRYDANEQPVSVNDEGPIYYDRNYQPMTLGPIPARDEVQIAIPNSMHIKNIEIYDIMGRRMTTTFTAEGNTATASVRGFAAGCYVVIARHETGVYSRTLIVEPR